MARVVCPGVANTNTGVICKLYFSQDNYILITGDVGCLGAVLCHRAPPTSINIQNGPIVSLTKPCS